MTEMDNKKYHFVLRHLVEKIRDSKQKAAYAVNNELLSVYWEIGRTILEQREEEGWGKKIIERLARDLKTEFPQMSGLSERNLVYMQTFATAWPFFPFTQPPVAELAESEQKAENPFTQPVVAELQTLVTQKTTVKQPLLALVPWTHHLLILDKVKSEQERIFYIIKVIGNRWSKNVLKANIETNLYVRVGNALNNFDTTLSKNHAELARLTLKNPYIFDFLDIEEEMHERDLESGLIKHIQRFLLEMGKGFAYVGNQYNLKVEENEFKLDLLFFNYHLNCFVVFELKVGDFKSEFAGKLNFYVNAIDGQIKQPMHNATIGVLLCKTPNSTVVKYALQGINTPLGVAEYELMPKQLQAEMPTIEELEQELTREFEVIGKPLDEKRNKLKEALARLKGEEIKNGKSRQNLFNLYMDVLFPLRNMMAVLLEEEMELFAKTSFQVRINETAKDLFMMVDLQQNSENVWRLGLSAYFNGFKLAGVKAFSVSSDLFIELREYKYELRIGNANPFSEYLYHHQWTKEQLDEVAEKWSEEIIDEINQNLERIL